MPSPSSSAAWWPRDGPRSSGVPTFPSRRFVSSGDLTVVHDGLLEYELVDLEDGSDSDGPRATALALTLLRATGMLSRMGMTTRPMTAGPMTPLDGPQMIGPLAVDYAVQLGETSIPTVWPTTSWSRSSPPRRSEVVGGPNAGASLTVRGGEVSSVRREAGRIEVRVFNPNATPATVEIPGRSGWLVDLRGRPVAAFEGHFDLRGHGIATVRLDGT